MFPFTVTATDIAGGTASHTFSNFQVVTTAPSAITFATTSLPVTAPTASYNETLQVSGGQGSLTLALVNGALPDGLSLAAESDGTPCISGTVSAAPGVYPFTLRATDSLGNAEYQAYQLVVNGVTASTKNLAANATTLVINGLRIRYGHAHEQRGHAFLRHCAVGHRCIIHADCSSRWPTAAAR